MKTNWVYKIVKYLKRVYFRNDKRVAAYLICVVIATGFWFLNAMGKEYTVDLIAPIRYVNLPKNKTLANNLPEQFVLTIKAPGFTILRRKISFLFLPLVFDVNDLTNDRMIEGKRNNYVFQAKQFFTKLSNQYEVDILSMNPDTLFFKYDKMGQKRVKVKLQVQVNLKKQYQISGDIKIVPDSVTVNGPQSALDTLKFVSTEIQQFNVVDRTILTKATIIPLNELFFEPQTVEVNIPVDEYTEAQRTVPVVLINQPADLNVILFPAKVNVSFQVSLSRFADIQPEDFNLTVSYSDILEGKQRLKITPESIPAYLYALKIAPEELEYLIENRPHD
ncbi:MAG TPA: CdaR family protein [Prolixibacteraceae bacterium]|nr:CdaR family protein [Prolixibacteraceae bacterium]